MRDFRGNDSTMSAIETGKRAKSGSTNAARPRFIMLSERSIKVLKRDTREVVTKHPVSSVCCVVRDPAEPAFFGYITTEPAINNQRYSHVFSTDCVVS